MESDHDVGEEIYSHHGVLVNKHTPCNHDKACQSSLGNLSVVKYNSSLEKCIEWHPCEVSVEAVADADEEEEEEEEEEESKGWTCIQHVKKQARTISESVKYPRLPVIQIQLNNLGSFKVSSNSQQLSFIECQGTSRSSFYFQNGNADGFVNFLKKILNTTVCKGERNLYLIKREQGNSTLVTSFAELDLLPGEDAKHSMWSFVKNIQDNPYEATMNVFCKVADAVLYKSLQQSSEGIEEIAELLNKSVKSNDSSDSSNKVLSERYEVITRGLPLPPRVIPPRFISLKPEQWVTFFDVDGRILEFDMVKELIFHGGIKPNSGLRKEVWKFLLGYYPWCSTTNEREILKKQKTEEYFTMKHQWKSMTPSQEDRFSGFKERKSLIEKDVYRTDRHMPFFAGDNNPNLEVLQDILMTYVMYNFDLGYVQGMSDLLSPLLVQINDEVDTFWCFVGFMNRVIRNFDMDQAGMKEQLQQLYHILCLLEPDFANYLDIHEAKNMSFCFRWLLIWFKREFSYEDIYLLWEVLWTESLCKNFHLLICAAILDNEKKVIMSNDYGFTEILKHINELANKMNIDGILKKAEAMYQQLSTAAKIPSSIREIIGLEPLSESEATEVNNDCDRQGNSDNINGGINHDNGNLGAISYSVQTQEIEFEKSMNLTFL